MTKRDHANVCVGPARDSRMDRLASRWVETVRVNIRIMAISCLVAATGLAGCSSSGGSSSAESPKSPGTSVSASGSPAATVGCPLNAAAVSAALKTQVVEVSVNAFQVPALCAFQTSSQPGLTVQITAFPFTTGRYKNRGLASIKDDLSAAAGESKSTGLTYRIIERPEWGTDAFSVLLYDARQAEGVQVWTTKYSSAIDDVPGQVSESAYLADATDLGDALVDASK